MADGVRVKVAGAAELSASLRQLGSEVATKIGVAAGRASARSVLAQMRVAAPYDPRNKIRRLSSGSIVNYGHIRSELKIRRATARKQGNIVFNVSAGRAYWSFFVEYGTRRMAAQPWMAPTLERMQSDVITVVASEIGRGVEKAAAKANRARSFGAVFPNGRNG